MQPLVADRFDLIGIWLGKRSGIFPTKSWLVSHKCIFEIIWSIWKKRSPHINPAISICVCVHTPSGCFAFIWKNGNLGKLFQKFQGHGYGAISATGWITEDGGKVREAHGWSKLSGEIWCFLEAKNWCFSSIWLALSREWRNEALPGYNGDSFPNSLLRASQLLVLLFRSTGRTTDYLCVVIGWCLFGCADSCGIYVQSSKNDNQTHFTSILNFKLHFFSFSPPTWGYYTIWRASFSNGLGKHHPLERHIILFNCPVRFGGAIWVAKNDVFS